MAFIVMMTMPSYFDYPQVRHMRDLSPQHHRIWKESRKEMGIRQVEVA